MKNISLVIPTWNEEKNIENLVNRIHKVLSAKEIAYEIIFVDDHSTDKTQNAIKKLLPNYDIKLHVKQGPQGKAYSLLEGFALAKYDVFCMIDADLQYPPEAIPAMLEKIEKGTHIIVANRAVAHTSLIRKFVSRSFMYVFAKLLHGFDFDVQSGLKVFRRDCIEGVELNPSPWAFDMEFLKKNIDRGCSVATVNIQFDKRVEGKAKINLVKASWEIGAHAVKLKLSTTKIFNLLPKLSYRKSA
jgi:dolichol-phosphate mannosyltransferase